MYSKYYKVLFYLNIMIVYYICILFKLFYRRYKLIVVVCRGFKRSLWLGWVRLRFFICSLLFKVILFIFDFCYFKEVAFYVDFIIVVILCFLILEFFFVLCKEEIVFS